MVLQSHGDFVKGLCTGCLPTYAITCVDLYNIVPLYQLSVKSNVWCRYSLQWRTIVVSKMPHVGSLNLCLKTPDSIQQESAQSDHPKTKFNILKPPRQRAADVNLIQRLHIHLLQGRLVLQFIVWDCD